MSETWFITDASSGFGGELAQLLLTFTKFIKGAQKSIRDGLPRADIQTYVRSCALDLDLPPISTRNPLVRFDHA